MSLTPEDRQRIYDEEKARAEAQNEIKKAKQVKNAQHSCLGCLLFLGILIGPFIFVGIQNSCENARVIRSVRQRTVTPAPLDEGSIVEPKQKHVTKKMLGKKWPLIIDEGEIVCYPPNSEHSGSIVFKSAGRTYYLNGIAKMKIGGNDIFEIVKPHEMAKMARQHPDLATMKMSVDPLIEIGDQLCPI